MNVAVMFSALKVYNVKGEDEVAEGEAELDEVWASRGCMKELEVRKMLNRYDIMVTAERTEAAMRNFLEVGCVMHEVTER